MIGRNRRTTRPWFWLGIACALTASAGATGDQTTRTVVIGDSVSDSDEAQTGSIRWVESQTGWSAQNAMMRLTMPRRADGWSTVETGAHSISFRAVGVAPGDGNLLSIAPVLGSLDAGESNHLAYTGILAQTEERFHVSARGLKHDIVLSNRPSWLGASTTGVVEMSWELRLSPSLSPWVEGARAGKVAVTTSGVLFKTTEGETPFYLSPARVFESAQVNGGDHPPSSVTASTRLEVVSPQLYRYHVIVPRNWLLDPARRFPVSIDPTVVVNPLGLTHTGFVTWDNAAIYDRLDGEIATGSLRGAFTWMWVSHGFARFDVSAIPDCAQITAIDLEARVANHDDPLAFPPRVAVPLPMQVTSCTADPLAATNVALFNAINTASQYHSSVVPRTGANFCLVAHLPMVFSLNATAIADLQAALPSDNFVIGLKSQVVADPLFDHLDYIGYPESVAGACGTESAPNSRIRLRVTYSTCCGNGTVTPGEQCDDGNTAPCDGCSATCQLECGNGTVECAETCDDGNTARCDGCSATCRIECGNGVQECAETCDDGNTTPCDGCSATCGRECGNGTRECAETCDDGNTAPCDGCSASCVLECGDGVRSCAETCDDGNTTPCDGCSATCRLECGNGAQECGETCDDGNTTGCDGCSATCRLECGDGIRSCAEQCDDGNIIACDGCSATCRLECGNGTRECAETCDDGNTTACDGCSASCRLECGDGIRSCSEGCDDGNITSCDGCSATCRLECGNGTVECAEQCDDGNTTNGDGCSSACQTELILSVTWLDINAVCMRNGVRVEWSVADENETYGYQVEVRNIHGSWANVGTPVWATGSYSSYQQIDPSVRAKVEYRIRELCLGGVDCSVSPAIPLDCTTRR